jgi:hypothetical protein
MKCIFSQETRRSCSSIIITPEKENLRRTRRKEREKKCIKEEWDGKKRRNKRNEE